MFGPLSMTTAYLFTMFLRARVLISNKIIATLDEAFNLIGETPMKTSTPLHDIFMEGSAGNSPTSSLPKRDASLSW